MNVLEQFEADIACEISLEHESSFLNLVYIDLDKFVYHNDALGHDIGDKTLAKILQTLQELSSANHSDFRRIRGDKFLGFSMSKEQAEHIELGKLAQKNIHGLAIPYVYKGYSDGSFEFSKFITCSVCVLSFSLESLSKASHTFGKQRHTSTMLEDNLVVVNKLVRKIENMMCVCKSGQKGNFTKITLSEI